MEKSITIIGKGIVGSFAAYSAKEKGYKVTIVDNGKGGTKQFSGILDIAGLPWLPLNERLNKNISENCEMTGKHFKSHVYSQYTGKTIYSFLKNILTNSPFNEFLSEVSVKNRLYLTYDGRVHTGGVSWQSVIPIPENEKLGFIGIENLSNFNTELSIENFNKTLKKIKLKSSFSSSKEIRINNGYNLDIIEINRLTDTSDKIIKVLAENIKKIDADTVFIPPILGIIKWRENLAFLEKECGKKISETPIAFGSPFGLRLQHELSKFLNDIEIYKDTVNGFKIEKGKISSIYLKSGKHLSSNIFLLTTGKFLSGGLERDTNWRETIFKLPLFFENKVIPGEQDIYKLFGESFFDHHKIWCLGVKTDKEGKTIDNSYTVFADNLYSAGGIIEGNNYQISGTGIGGSLFTLRKLRWLNE